MSEKCNPKMHILVHYCIEDDPKQKYSRHENARGS